jgi:hypothetical protein
VALTQEQINNVLFLDKREYGKTACHMVSEKGQIETLHRRWDWTKYLLTQEELKIYSLANIILK